MLSEKHGVRFRRRDNDVGELSGDPVTAISGVLTFGNGEGSDLPPGRLAQQVSQGKGRHMPGLFGGLVLVCLRHGARIPDEVFLAFVVEAIDPGSALHDLPANYIVQMSPVPAFLPFLFPLACRIDGSQVQPDECGIGQRSEPEGTGGLLYSPTLHNELPVIAELDIAQRKEQQYGDRSLQGNQCLLLRISNFSGGSPRRCRCGKLISTASYFVRATARRLLSNAKTSRCWSVGRKSAPPEMLSLEIVRNRSSSWAGLRKISSRAPVWCTSCRSSSTS